MSDGLITRIGKWIDSKFEEKVTRSEFEALKAQTWIGPKEFDELKTRMEKLELYVGVTRKVDPSKPPVAKSAFSM